MSYKPTFVANGLDEHYVWSGSTIVGKVNWRDDWGTFVFCPFNNTFFGPVFLSDLVTKLIELEARKRKRICPKCGCTELIESTFIDAAGDVDGCYRCKECGTIVPT